MICFILYIYIFSPSSSFQFKEAIIVWAQTLCVFDGFYFYFMVGKRTYRAHNVSQLRWPLWIKSRAINFGKIWIIDDHDIYRVWGIYWIKRMHRNPVIKWISAIIGVCVRELVRALIMFYMYVQRALCLSSRRLSAFFRIGRTKGLIGFVYGRTGQQNNDRSSLI